MPCLELQQLSAICRGHTRRDKLLKSLADGLLTTELTLGFAEVQGMVRYWHPESLSRVDVSPRVVVALGVFLLGGGDRIEEEEEEKRSNPEHTEKPPFLVRVEDGLHWTVSMRARKVTDWQQRAATQLWLERFEGDFFRLLFLFFGEVSMQLAAQLSHYRHLLVQLQTLLLKGGKCRVV